MKIISCVNQKGGVGKTTTTLNVASGLAKLGKRVLVPFGNGNRGAEGIVLATGRSPAVGEAISMTPSWRIAAFGARQPRSRQGGRLG